MEPLESVKPQTPDEIATTLQPFFHNEGISVRANSRDDCLYILIEAFHVPDRLEITDLLKRQRYRSGMTNFKTVRVYFRRKPDKMVIWQEYLDWNALEDLPEEESDADSDVPSADQAMPLATDRSNQSHGSQSMAEDSASEPVLPAADEIAGSAVQQGTQLSDHQSQQTQTEEIQAGDGDQVRSTTPADDPSDRPSDRPAYAQAENDSVFDPDRDSDQSLLDALAEALGTANDSKSSSQIPSDSAPQNGGDAPTEQFAPASDVGSDVKTPIGLASDQSDQADLDQAIDNQAVDDQTIDDRAIDRAIDDRASALKTETETPDSQIDSPLTMQPDSETVDRANSAMTNMTSDSPDETSSRGMSDPTPPDNNVPDPWEEASASTAQASTSAAKAAPPHLGRQESDDSDDGNESDLFDSEQLKKPQALILLALYTIFVFVRAFLELLDSATEEDDTDYSMSDLQLASRLKIRNSTLNRFKDRDYFGEWSKTLDPDGISWAYRSDGRFEPAIVQVMRQEKTDA